MKMQASRPALRPITLLTSLLVVIIFLVARTDASTNPPVEEASAAVLVADASIASPVEEASADILVADASIASPGEEASTSVSAAVCSPPNFTLLTALGNTGNNPNFKKIAEDFKEATLNYAADSLLAFSAVGPEEFTKNLGGLSFTAQMDQYMIGFYTGHSSPTHFDMQFVSPPSIAIKDFPPLGQCDDTHQGQLRYLLLSSCNTFAHGPKQACTDTTSQGSDYACPGEWQYDPKGDKETMRSAYARWGPVLGNGLRMACGASTALPPANAVAMWEKYGDNMSVADAILASLSNLKDVSICLARGGQKFAQSPLVDDKRFTTTDNRFDDDPANVYYHLQYSKPFSDPYSPVPGVLINNEQTEMRRIAAYFKSLSDPFPGCLPAIETSESQPKIYASGQQLQSLEAFRSEAEALNAGPGEAAYVSNAQKVLGQIGLGDPGVRPQFAYGVHMLLNTIPVTYTEPSQVAYSFPVTHTEPPLRVTEKNAIVTFPQIIRLDQVKGVENMQLENELARLTEFNRKLTPRYESVRSTEDDQPLVRVLDGNVQIQLNTDLTPIHGVNRWQPIEQAFMGEQVRPPDEAFLRSLWLLYYREAYKALKGGDADEEGLDREDVMHMLVDKEGTPLDEILNVLEKTYEQDGQQPYLLNFWTLGYTRRRVYEEQPQLRVVYRFRFAPNERAEYTAATRPPLYIDVDGQIGNVCAGGLG